jgi:hypothetical protein
MKHLNMSYNDIRSMPIRYRNWYIDRLVKSVEEEAELRRRINQESSSKSVRNF